MLRVFFAHHMTHSRRSALVRIQALSRQFMSTPTAAGPPLPTDEPPPVLFEQKSLLRKYVLNRPASLNALSETMLDMLASQIISWKKSPLCYVVAGTSSTPKHFCSGGDIKALGELVAQEKHDEAVTYFAKEFSLDYYLSILGKPYVAVMDGTTMGGGVGLTAPAPFRVATEKTVFAMPETVIGYFPDVGASYYLNQLDGYLGTYLSLTGVRLTGRSVFELGFATHYIPSSRLPVLWEHLSEAKTMEQVNDVLESLSAERESDDPPTPFSSQVRNALDDAFSASTVEKIVDNLTAYEGDHHSPSEVRDWAKDTLGILRRMSPTSLKVSLRAIRKGKSMDLASALQMELGIAAAFCHGTSRDFVHGIQQQFHPDKEQRTRRSWQPPKLEDVTDDIVDKFFPNNLPSLGLSDELLRGAENETTKLEKEGEDPEDAPPLAESVDFNEYTLPTQDTIEGLVRGSHPAAGAMGITTSELVNQVEALVGDKVGLEGKVRDVVERKCRIVDNKDGNYVWLRWID